jgi:hypothetical protein
MSRAWRQPRGLAHRRVVELQGIGRAMNEDPELLNIVRAGHLPGGQRPRFDEVVVLATEPMLRSATAAL